MGKQRAKEAVCALRTCSISYDRSILSRIICGCLANKILQSWDLDERRRSCVFTVRANGRFVEYHLSFFSLPEFSTHFSCSGDIIGVN